MSEDRPTEPVDPDSILPFLEEAVEPEPGLSRRVRSSIESRMLAGDAVGLSLGAFFRTFLDYLMLALSFVGGDNDEKKGP